MIELADPLTCPRGVTFDEETHRYTMDGRPVSSVSARLRVLHPDAYAGVPKHILDAAADRGSRLHWILAKDVRGWLNLEDVDDDLVDDYLAWGELVDREELVITHSEFVVASRRHWFAGTLDLAGYFQKNPSQRVLIDTKRVYTLPVTVGPQTAGYEIGYRETLGISESEKIDRYALHFAKGSAQLVPLSDPNDRPAFLAANNVVRWRENHGID